MPAFRFHPPQREQANIHRKTGGVFNIQPFLDMIPVIHDSGNRRFNLAQYIFIYHHHVHSCGARIFLCAGINKTEMNSS